MGKKVDESLEKQPLAVGAKLLEMKGIKEEVDRSLRLSHIKEGVAGEKAAGMKVKAALKAAKEPMQLKIKKTRSLGDVYGKFHPSKSTKGIKRSE